MGTVLLSLILMFSTIHSNIGYAMDFNITIFQNETVKINDKKHNIQLLRINDKLVLKIGDVYKMIADSRINEDLDNFDMKPHIKIDKQPDDTLLVFVGYSVKTNGGTDGLYYLYAFKYDDAKISSVWDANLSNYTIDMQLSKDKIATKVAQKTGETLSSFEATETSGHKYINGMYHYGNKDIFSASLSLREAEMCKILPNTNNLRDYIVIKNPSFIEEKNLYITSLFSIWDTQNSINLKKAFVLNRYSLESYIVTKIMNNGRIQAQQERLLFPIIIQDVKYTEQDFIASLQFLMDSNIIILIDNMHYIDFGN